jgi:hypothetical protein
MKIGSANNITIILIFLLLSTILLVYMFEFGFVHAQNYDDNNNNNNEIDNDFDYIFDPSNYVEFEEEKKEKVVVRNDNSDNVVNQDNLVQSSSSSSSSSTSNFESEAEVEGSNNINTVNKKNSESKLNFIDGNNDDNQKINNKNNEYLDYVNNDNEENKQENYNLDDKVIVKTRLNLENIEKEGYLNIAAFINGQGVLKNVSLDKVKPTKKTLTVNLAVDKETDIVQAGSRDEFFVCVYHIKDLQKKSTNSLTYFDCDEGDLAGPDETTISRLFSASSQTYQKSQNIFTNSSSKYSQLITSNKNINNNNNINRNLQEENVKLQEDTIKIKVYAPLEDRKDIQKLKIIAMVKGQIKSVVIDNVQEEFDKIGGYKVSRTFTFDRDTNIGKIQTGDKFFTCVSSIDLNPPEGTECEKRTIKYTGEKENVLYAR